MRRREFIGLLAGAILLSRPIVHAEPVRDRQVARIGILITGPVASRQRQFEVFRGRLRDLGWIEGRNLATEYRSANGRPERFPELAAELVHLNVDVILALGTPAA